MHGEVKTLLFRPPNAYLVPQIFEHHYVPERPGDYLSSQTHIAQRGRPHPDLLVDRSTARPTPACRRTSGPLKEEPRECWSRSTPLPLGEVIASRVELVYGKLRRVDMNSIGACRGLFNRDLTPLPRWSSTAPFYFLETHQYFDTLQICRDFRPLCLSWL